MDIIQNKISLFCSLVQALDHRCKQMHLLIIFNPSPPEEVVNIVHGTKICWIGAKNASPNKKPAFAAILKLVCNFLSCSDFWKLAQTCRLADIAHTGLAFVSLQNFDWFFRKYIHWNSRLKVNIFYRNNLILQTVWSVLSFEWHLSKIAEKKHFSNHMMKKSFCKENLSHSWWIQKVKFSHQDAFPLKLNSAMQCVIFLAISESSCIALNR